MKKIERLMISLLCFLLVIPAMPGAILGASANFEQGGGYQPGKYDPLSPQPTAFNWSRQSSQDMTSEPVQKWVHDSVQGYSPVVGSDGTIYQGFKAINPNGTEKWQFKVDDPNILPWNASIGQDGTIYIGAQYGYLYALRPDGTQKWRYNAGNTIISSPAIGSDGTIYVGAFDRGLQAVNPDGTQKWMFSTWEGSTYDSFAFSSPAIGSDGTLYIGSQNGYLYAISSMGVEKWRVKIGTNIASSPAIGADGTIYIGSNDNSLYAFQPDGTIKWKFATGGSIGSSPAISKDGTIYIGSNDKKLYAIQPDGTKKWEFTLTDRIHMSSPLIDSNGTIYIGSYDHYLYAIHADGTEKWKMPTTGAIDVSSPAIGLDETVYVTSGGKLHAFGKELRGLTLNAEQYSLAEGDTYQIHVQAQYSDGSTADVTAKAAFESLQPETAQVDATGKVTGIKAGETKIQVSFEELTSILTINVMDVAPPGPPSAQYDQNRVTGTAEVDSMINVKANETVIGTGQAVNGNFTIEIEPQQPGTILAVTATDAAGNESSPTSITVDTKLAGGIFEDTTLKRENSPYTITSDVIVFPDATLTIEPGVELHFEPGVGMIVRGSLVSEGLENNKILFTSKGTQEKDSWKGIQIATNLGGKASIKNSDFSYSGTAINVECCWQGGPVDISYSTFTSNTVALGGYAGWKMTVKDSLFQNNTYAITSADKVIYNSVFDQNTYGLFNTERISVYNSVFTNNQVALNGGRGEVKYSQIKNNGTGVQGLYDGFSLSHNEISSNGTGIILSNDGGRIAPIQNNNIFGNTEMNMKNTSSNNVDATQNWWNTSDAMQIRAKLWDGYDDFSLGIINFKPVLDKPSTIGITPPTVHTPIGDHDLALTGKAEEGTTITVRKEGVVIGTAVVPASGDFSVPISLQAVGTQLEVIASDGTGMESEAVYVTVQDTSAPESPVLRGEITEVSTELSGTAEANTTITVVIGDVVAGTTTVGTDGIFTFSFEPQPAGTEIIVTATDPSGNISGKTKKVVRKQINPADYLLITQSVTWDSSREMEKPVIISPAAAVTIPSGVTVKLPGDLIVYGQLNNSGTLDMQGHHIYANNVDMGGIKLVGDEMYSSYGVIHSTGFIQQVGNLNVNPGAYPIPFTNSSPPDGSIHKGLEYAFSGKTIPGFVLKAGEQESIASDQGDVGLQVELDHGGENHLLLELRDIFHARFQLDLHVNTQVFSDDHLEQAVREALSKEKGEFTRDELASLESLDASGRQIKNLTGMKYVSNLQNLNLSDNQIEAIDEIYGLTKLKNLDLQSNHMTGLGVLLSYTQAQYGTGLNEGGVVNVSHNYINLSDAFNIEQINQIMINGVTLVYEPQIDVYAPATPEVDPMTDQSTVITGTAEKGSTIIARVGTTELGRVEVQGDGSFTLPIERLDAGAEIEVTVMDSAGNVSEGTKVVVRDATPPAAPVVDEVTDQSSEVTGTAEVGSTVTVKAGTTELGQAIAGEDGRFLLPIERQAAGTELEVTATDPAGNVSDGSQVIVSDVTPPNAPVVDEVTDQSREVTGTAEAGSTVTVKAGTTELGQAVVEGDGHFILPIERLDAGTEIEVTVMDPAGNISEGTKVIVRDATPPNAPVVAEVTDQSTEITGTAAAGSQISIRVGDQVKETTAGEDGTFAISIEALAPGTLIQVTAKDEAGNESEVTQVIVADITPPKAPFVDEVTDQATALTGTAEAGTQILVMVDHVGIGTGVTGDDGVFSIPVEKMQAGQTIAVIAKDPAGNESEATSVVVGATIQGIQVNRESLVLEMGETKDITIQALYSDGNIRDVTGEANYIVSEPSRVNVSNGTFLGLQTGQVEVTVEYAGFSKKILITVVEKNGHFANGKIVVQHENVGHNVKLTLEYHDLSADFVGMQLNIPLKDIGLYRPVFEIDPASGLQKQDIMANQIVNGVYTLVIGGDRLVSSPVGKDGVVGTLTFDASSYEELQLGFDRIIVNVNNINNPEEVKVEKVSMSLGKVDSIRIPEGYNIYDVNRDTDINITDYTNIMFYIVNHQNIQEVYPRIPINTETREVATSAIKDNMYFYDVNLDGNVNITDYTMINYYLVNKQDIQAVIPNYKSFEKKKVMMMQSLAEPDNGGIANGKVSIEGTRVNQSVELAISYQDLHAGLTGFQINIPLPQEAGITNPVFHLDPASGLQESDILADSIVDGVYTLIIGGERLINHPLGIKGTIGTIHLDTATTSAMEPSIKINEIYLNVDDIFNTEISDEEVWIQVQKPFQNDVNQDGIVDLYDLIHDIKANQANHREEILGSYGQ